MCTSVFVNVLCEFISVSFFIFFLKKLTVSTFMLRESRLQKSGPLKKKVFILKCL